MKYVDEFRDQKIVETISKQISSVCNNNWSIMEICGGQTHSIMKYNLIEFLPSEIKLIHGPGCPVCVTPIEKIDQAITISSRKDLILTSYGDMLRVPGTTGDLLGSKANGADIRMIYSPLDAIKIAKNNPNKEVVFFAIGFETTAPANALAIIQAKKDMLKNFSMLSSHVLVPPAIEFLLGLPQNRIQAFLAAGHVCTVMGYSDYHKIAKKYKVPIIVTGFEPVDILSGILAAIKQLENGLFFTENLYKRSVKEDGNPKARETIFEVFEPTDYNWRGIGEIPLSGLKIKSKYLEFDAELKFPVNDLNTSESEICIAGEILQGIKKPFHCLAYGKECTPEKPLGAPMVSHEGACSAYFRYRIKVME